MMNQPPFRMPCEAVAGEPRYFFGARWQHNIAAIKVAKFANTTLISGSAPTEQWAADPGSSCGTYFMPTGTAWSKPYPTNVFTDTGDFVDMTVVHKRGFKNVYARRQWHGVLPWTAPEAGCLPILCPSGHQYRTYQATASQTRYGTVTPDISYSVTNGQGSPYSTTASCTGSRTVDPLSGKITSTIETFEDDYTDTIGMGTQHVKHIAGGAGYVSGDGGLTFTTYAKDLTTVIDPAAGADVHCTTPHAPTDGGLPGSATDLDLVGLIAYWNATPGNAAWLFPYPPSDLNNYDETVTATPSGTETTIYRISWSRTATVFTFDVSFDDTNTGGHYTSFFSGTITLSNPNTAGDLKSDLVSLLAWWPLNDDSLYPWRTDLKTGVAPLVTRDEIPTNITPVGFNTYTVDDLANPVDDASANHPFDPGWSPTWAQIAWFDPVVYIWKFNPPTNSTDAAANVLIQQYDGSILGKPQPAGYQDNFDFKFKDIRGCCDRPGGGIQTWSWNTIGYGQNVSTFNSNTGSQIPLNATQWNNWLDAINKPPCAFMFYSDQSDYYGAGCVSSSGTSKAGDAGAFVMGKWAEIIDIWPSENFARPAGDDKFAYDENFVYCATLLTGGPGGDSGLDYSGSTFSLIDPRTGLAPADPSVFSTITLWGGSMVEGFYDVSYSGGVVTLVTKIYDSPAGWLSKSGDDASCFGGLRFPDAPSLLGRIAITPDMAGTTFTFATAQPNFGMDTATHQEQVDVYDASMTVLASNITATRVDDSNFSLPTAYLTAAFVQINGSPAWYMNDSSPKGDFTVLDWTADLRSIGEYNTLAGMLDCDGVQVTRPTTNAGGGPVTQPFAEFNQIQCCLPFVPCAPKVICISPNGETFPNGITYDFPSTFLLDEQYGSKWWSKPEPIMTDIFWQTPHRPCNIEACAQWLMDDGSCNANVGGTCPATDESPAPKYFYGLAPQVEARITVPAFGDDCSKAYGADGSEAGPAVPAGVQIGWLSPVNYSTGDVALPPLAPATSSDGTPGGYAISSFLHASLCASVLAGCRFGYSLSGCDTCCPPYFYPHRPEAKTPE
jgi:hypothetical protein